MRRDAPRSDNVFDMGRSPRYIRDHQRQSLFQALFAFAAAVLLALSISAALSVDSHAAIDCTARSVSTSSSQCDVSSVPEAPR